MPAKIINGKALAAEIKAGIKQEVLDMLEKGYEAPGLATVLVGDNPPSKTYVAMKHKTCEELGFKSFNYELPATTCQSALEAVIAHLNEDRQVSGILVQQPLPEGLNEEAALQLVSIEKDVDGFHPINIGRLAQKGRNARLLPCTPKGIVHLLKTELGDLRGKRAVVLGRSNIVGMPTALMLVKEDATVTICHSYSMDLPSICREADILIAAVGNPQLVKADWVKPGAVVIDVGITRIDDPTNERGYRMVGDVDFQAVSKVASAITKVTGGVGPMTIAMLMQNTLLAAKIQQGYR